MLTNEDYDLLKDCWQEVDKFSRDGMRETLSPAERLSLNVLLDGVKPLLFNRGNADG
jgi:hypothetical protein